MKVRKIGKIRTAHLVINAKWGQRIAALLTPTAAEEAERIAKLRAQWDELLAKMDMAGLVEPNPEGENQTTATWYNVAKKSTGEIVGTFSTLEAALGKIETAKRQKKAALVLA